MHNCRAVPVSTSIRWGKKEEYERENEVFKYNR